MSLYILLLGVLPSQASVAPTVDSLLRVLDQTLAHQSTYDQQRLAHIAHLTTEFRAQKADAATRYEMALRIYYEYQVFKYDSAFAYSLRLAALARHLHSPARLQTARTKLALTLHSAGLFKNAFDTLKAINPQQLALANKVAFYEIYSIVCIELAEYEPNTYYHPLSINKAYAYAATSARYAPSIP